jgi:hypothetical protein
MLSNRLNLPVSRLIFVSVAINILIFVSYTYRSSLADISRLPHRTKTGQPPDRGPKSAKIECIPCYESSEVPVIDSIAEQLGSVPLSGGGCKYTLTSLSSTDLDLGYPQSLGGSNEAVGLSRTWVSAAARYGPYGYAVEEASHRRKPVNWDYVDWSQLVRLMEMSDSLSKMNSSFLYL